MGDDLGPHLALDVQQFRDGLDDHRGTVNGGWQVGGERDPLQRLARLRRVQGPAFDKPRQARLNRRARPGKRRVVDVVDRGLIAGHRRELGNAIAHDPAADDRDTAAGGIFRTLVAHIPYTIGVTFALDQTYVDLQAEAREVAASISEFAAVADGMSSVHPGVLSALASSRLFELMVPAGYGGRFERLDPLAIAVVRETLMATSSHADSLFGLQGIGSYAITAGGTDEQRAAWLPKVVSGEALAALGLTEPEA